MSTRRWEPTWSRQDRMIHISYDLPHRVYDAQIYPVISPNSSTIIVYGHREGLTIVWRGGRPFKQSSPPKGKSSKSNEIVILDDDEDDIAETTQTGLAAFDEEEAEFDEEAPYDEVIHTEEVPFDIEVHRIALPKLPSSSIAHTEHSVPPILGQKMVIAAACADGSVRLVTIDLTPKKGTTSKDVGKVLVVPPQGTILAASQALTMTWTGRQALDSSRGSAEKPPAWSFLLANHTSSAGGLLSVYQIDLNEKGTEPRRKEVVSLLREEHIDLQSGVLSFSSSHYPSHYHAQLLVGSAGAVRIYEPLPKAKSHHSSHQPSHGTWLASFHVPFESQDSVAAAVGRRKRILDAQWTSDGLGIIVLLADGQWGVWDIEGTSSRAASVSKRDDYFASTGGISGGGITRFALRGFVGEHAAAMAAKLDLSGGHSSAKEARKLTPMTPNTRKAKQQALFSGGNTTNSTGQPRGGITVSATSMSGHGSEADVSIIIHYENALYPITSLLSHWRSAAGGKNSGTLQQLKGFSSRNDNITSISQATLPRQSRFTPSSSLPLDVLITTSHRLNMICSIRTETASSEPAARRLFPPTTSVQAVDLMDDDMNVDEEDILRMDQDMLSKGQLDLGGLDRMLGGMNGSGQTDFENASLGGNTLGFTKGNGSMMAGRASRRVGFAAGI